MDNLPQTSQTQEMIRPIISPGAVIEAHKATADLIAQTLKKGTDFGEVSGTKSLSLLKAGGERLSVAFGCHPEYEILEKEINHTAEVPWKKRKWNDRMKRYDELVGSSFGIYRYVVRCSIIQNSTGRVVGSQIGSCSTMESKYIDRPRDCENTALKMAQKRAMVGAVLNAFGLSDRFTTDMEDVHDNEAEGATTQGAGYSASNAAHKKWFLGQCSVIGLTDQVAIDALEKKIVGLESEEATKVIESHSKKG